MNLTKALAGNVSSSLVDCEQMLSSMRIYFVDQYKGFNNNLGSYLTSFLFNIMGNALKIKNILDSIQNDINK